MAATILGAFGVILCIVMYGSMYVPVKKYKTYDGMLFQWYTSSGTVLIGVVVGILFDWGDDEGIKVPWEGMLGGMLYSIVSVIFPLAVKLTGLALGFVLWCGFSIVTGWAISRFGWFGLTQDNAKYPFLDITAIILCLVALIMMMFIKPDSVSVTAVKPSENDKKRSKQEQKLLEYERVLANAENNSTGINENEETNPPNEIAPNMWPTSSHERASKNFRRRRVSMEIVQSSSLIPTAYLFGTWLDFDQIAKDKYFERKLKKKYNDDTIGITTNTLDFPVYGGRTPSVAYGSTSSMTNSDMKQNASVNLKTLKTHSVDIDEFSDTSDTEDDLLVEQYREMRTNYQWLKLLFGRCECSPQGRRLFGIFLASLEGVMCAMTYVPYLYWAETHTAEIDDNELYILNYVFSYTIGIYLGSTFFFCVMGVYKRCRKLFWPKPVVRPAFSSGCMYALGYAGFLFSTAYGSYPVCYVAAMVGSIVLSNLWSLLYFKEITNRKSIKLLSISLLLMTVAILLEAVAG